MHFRPEDPSGAALDLGQPPARPGPSGRAPTLEFAMEAACLMRDRHCEDIILFDVRAVSDVCDFILLASGTSDRQILGVAEEVADLARDAGHEPLGREADSPARWIVLDYVDVVMHLFDSETRNFYDLEMMWGDVPRVPWDGGAKGPENDASTKVADPADL